MSRQFCFVLLATVAAFSTFGPAQNSHSPHKSAARSAASTRAAGPQPAPAAPAAGSSSQAPAPAGAPKACDHHEQWANLHRAQFEFENLRYPSAANQFSSLITSCDVWVQGESELGLQRANAAMSTWWWLEGLYFPPLRWYHHPRFWEAVGRTLLILVVILVILAFLFYWTDLVRWATEFLSVVPHRDQLRAFFLVQSLPRANIMMPSELVKDTQSKLFASMLESACRDVSRVLERAGGGLQVRATALLALPSETTSQLVEAMPKVRGVDVAGLVKFILYVKRYFGWRVELSGDQGFHWCRNAGPGGGGCVFAPRLLGPRWAVAGPSYRSTRL